ncbi:rRNA maturation RNase YbeY [Virgibacillus ihumii]|uniref:rRNA maturation RNase YbeY n=1 Tax=Virgibacillus ihumii TaxID=2686091 RepID=UPI00157D494F|nr:rRNA maturation RNase YbeY [Virgibacillus ihumii]
MHIDFHDQTNSISSDYVDLLQRLILFTADAEGIAPGTEVSVSFVSNKEIQELNRNYRQQDKSTDVISFAMQEIGEGELDIISEDMPVVLGDIVISVEKAQEQADEYGHSFERELSFLAVHGFLHLLGYDHMSEADESNMFKRQHDILGEFGIER